MNKAQSKTALKFQWYFPSRKASYADPDSISMVAFLTELVISRNSVMRVFLITWNKDCNLCIIDRFKTAIFADIYSRRSVTSASVSINSKKLNKRVNRRFFQLKTIDLLDRFRWKQAPFSWAVFPIIKEQVTIPSFHIYFILFYFQANHSSK